MEPIARIARRTIVIVIPSYLSAASPLPGDVSALSGDPQSEDKPFHRGTTDGVEGSVTRPTLRWRPKGR